MTSVKPNVTPNVRLEAGDRKIKIAEKQEAPTKVGASAGDALSAGAKFLTTVGAVRQGSEE